MLKKLLSTILAVSLMLSMAFVVNTAAATKSYANLDLGSKNIGDVISSHGGHQTKTVVVLEDGEKAVVMAPNKTEYDLDGTTVKLLNFAGVSGSAALSESNAKGIVFESTLKITSSSDALILVTNTGNVSPRYLTLHAGSVKCNTTFGSSAVATGVTYPVNSWFTIKLSWNMTTGYMEISVKDLNTGVENKKAQTDANWIKSASALTAVQTFSWYLEGSSGYAYIRSLSVLTEDDATAIAPSKVLIRDNFDNNTNTLSGWSGSGAVATTDRGKSAQIVCDTAEKGIYKAIELKSDAKGLVSEFSVKLTATTGTEFIYANNRQWWSPNYKLIQFTGGGKIHAFDNAMPLGDYKANAWYDIRIENNFTNGFTRVSIFDGENERLYEATRQNSAWESAATNLNQVQFISNTAMTTPKSIYIDDINVYYLTESEVLGLKNPRIYAVHNEFENFAEGDMQEDLLDNVNCAAEPSFKAVTTPAEDEFEVGIESVVNSGRGKSFKASLIVPPANSSVEKGVYKDFAGIKNAVAEFDMLLSEKSGEVAIKVQSCDENNSNWVMEGVGLIRFNADGNIYNQTKAEDLGDWEEGKWYHIKLTAGMYNVDGAEVGGVKADVYDGSGALLATNTVNTSYDSITRDAFRNVKFTIAEAANTLYVDNFKVYSNTEVQGLFPTPSYFLRNKQVAPDGTLTIAFSKVVNLANSKFKVNGEVVSATLSGGNVVKLNKAISEGETYDIEYKAADTDGYVTSGYIGGISVPRALIIEGYTAATVENPSASVKVTINSADTTKRVQLIVAAYNEAETRLLDVNIQSAAAGTGEQTLTATVDNTGATKIKTFLWDGASLTPIRAE